MSDYGKYAESKAEKSPIFKNCVNAFWVGGLICVLGQGFSDIYKALGIGEENVRTLVPVTLIFLTVLFTGMGFFDKITKFAGAGAFVPISGFANAVASPAIDNKAEGWILGLGAKIFIIAGPVILYGTLASALYGVIYYVVGVFA